MAKSATDKSQRENAELKKLSSSSEQGSESLRTLQSENQRLRELVLYLWAAFRQNIEHDAVGECRTLSSGNAKQSTHILDVLSKPSPIHELLTSRERAVLGEIMKGASSKEAAQTLAISVRTVEFHRANILQKLAAKNTADLMRIVLSE